MVVVDVIYNYDNNRCDCLKLLNHTDTTETSSSNKGIIALLG
jgi:hypothetical protein